MILVFIHEHLLKNRKAKVNMTETFYFDPKIKKYKRGPTSFFVLYPVFTPDGRNPMLKGFQFDPFIEI